MDGRRDGVAADHAAMESADQGRSRPIIERMSAAPRHAHENDLEDALRGPSPADARESLVYWRGRLDGLPRRKRKARREAQAMVDAWEERVRRAEVERWGGGMLGRAAGAVAVLRTLHPRALVKRATGLVPRRLVVGVVAVVIGSAVLLGVLVGAALAALL
jgi:hypothetical protein